MTNSLRVQRKPLSQSVMTGRFVRIEQVNLEKHAEGMLKIHSSQDGQERFRYMSNLPPLNLEQEIKYLTVKEPSCYFIVIEQESNEIVGGVGYFHVDEEEGTAEIGIFFSDKLGRKSGGTEVMYLMAKNFFENGYRRLGWDSDNRNEKSKNAALRFGFVYEAFLPQESIQKSELADTAMFSMTDKDWSINKLAFEEWLNPKNFDAQGLQKERLTDIRIRVMENLKSKF